MSMNYEETLAHFGIKGMHWGSRKANPEREAKKAARKSASIKRGEDTLYRSNAFNNPSLAIGMKAAGVVMTGVSAGLAIKSIGNPKFKTYKKLKQGMALTGLVLSGVSAASTLRDIHDINAYKKSEKEAGR